jgi:hypothetical protein
MNSASVLKSLFFMFLFIFISTIAYVFESSAECKPPNEFTFTVNKNEFTVKAYDPEAIENDVWMWRYQISPNNPISFAFLGIQKCSENPIQIYTNYYSGGNYILLDSPTKSAYVDKGLNFRSSSSMDILWIQSNADYSEILLYTNTSQEGLVTFGLKSGGEMSTGYISGPGYQYCIKEEPQGQPGLIRIEGYLYNDASPENPIRVWFYYGNDGCIKDITDYEYPYASRLVYEESFPNDLEGLENVTLITTMDGRPACNYLMYSPGNTYRFWDGTQWVTVK